MRPTAAPKSVICTPDEDGIRQLSLPPPPIIVGPIADITGGCGCDPGEDPAPL